MNDPTPARRLLDAMASEGERLRDVIAWAAGTVRFDTPASRLLIRIGEGRIDVSESDEPAQCVLALDEDLLVDVLSGRRNLLTVTLQGRVRWSGDLTAGELFHWILRGWLEQRREQPTLRP